MHRIAFLLFFFTTQFSFAQTEIDWQTLADVEFTDVYMEEVDEYFLYPHFGTSVRELAGQEIMIRGFVLAIDPTKNYYILSKGPFSSCFFCGVGGPETIIELEMKSSKDVFIMDEVATIKGRLKLNTDDIYQCNYILQDAEVYLR
ncbi:hypothetical protein N9V43_00930 [Flavobacteriales bacterium]|jgi:hypothetical protein|nr:hypothetical protein [Flavobacteriales bacterium]